MTVPTLGMVLKGYPRISETFISNEILLLEQLGIPIRIFSMRLPRENFCHDSVREIEAPVDYLPTDLCRDFPRLLFGAALCAMRAPGNFREALSLAAKRYRRTDNLGTLKHLLQAGFLVGHLLRRCPEVVHFHAHFAHSPSSVALFASLLGRRGFSFTAHAKDIYTSSPDQLAEKIALARFVVTCTEHNRDYLQRLHPQGTTPIHCVYHGIDLQLFNRDAFSRVPGHRPLHILTVARLTEKKGIPTILQALHRLRHQGMDFIYTLIGDGDDRERLLAMIVDLNLQDRCRWLGTLTHAQVVREFADTDLFVLGCRITDSGDRDGIPNVLVESLAMGVPAVATRISALPEILVPEQTGLLVEPNDAEAMAVAIRRGLTDPALRQRLAREGRQWVADRFDNRALVHRLAAILRGGIPGLGRG